MVDNMDQHIVFASIGLIIAIASLACSIYVLRGMGGWQLFKLELRDISTEFQTRSSK